MFTCLTLLTDVNTPSGTTLYNCFVCHHCHTCFFVLGSDGHQWYHQREDWMRWREAVLYPILPVCCISLFYYQTLHIAFFMWRFQHLWDFYIKQFLWVLKCVFVCFVWLQGSCWEWLSTLLAEQSDSVTRRQWRARYASAFTSFSLCIHVWKPGDFSGKVSGPVYSKVPTGLCTLQPIVVRQNGHVSSHPLLSALWVRTEDIILMDSMSPRADVFILLTLYFSLTSFSLAAHCPMYMADCDSPYGWYLIDVACVSDCSVISLSFIFPHAPESPGCNLDRKGRADMEGTPEAGRCLFFTLLTPDLSFLSLMFLPQHTLTHISRVIPVGMWLALNMWVCDTVYVL